MLKYKTETRPGLVALYYIRPRNGGACVFLQPRCTAGRLLFLTLELKPWNSENWTLWYSESQSELQLQAWDPRHVTS